MITGEECNGKMNDLENTIYIKYKDIWFDVSISKRPFQEASAVAFIYGVIVVGMLKNNVVETTGGLVLKLNQKL